MNVLNEPNVSQTVDLSWRRRPGTLPCFALVKQPGRPLPGEVLCVPPERCLPLAGMEWVDVEHRTFSGILTSMFWSIGNMLLAAIAYLVREWRWLLVAVTGPCLLSIVCLWWVQRPTAGRLVGMGAGRDLPPLLCERGKSCNADPRIGSSDPKRSGTRLCLALGLPRGGSSNEPSTVALGTRRRQDGGRGQAFGGQVAAKRSRIWCCKHCQAWLGARKEIRIKGGRTRPGPCL